MKSRARCAGAPTGDAATDLTETLPASIMSQKLSQVVKRHRPSARELSPRLIASGAPLDCPPNYTASATCSYCSFFDTACARGSSNPVCCHPSIIDPQQDNPRHLAGARCKARRPSKALYRHARKWRPCPHCHRFLPVMTFFNFSAPRTERRKSSRTLHMSVEPFSMHLQD